MTVCLTGPFVLPVRLFLVRLFYRSVCFTGPFLLAWNRSVNWTGPLIGQVRSVLDRSLGPETKNCPYLVWFAPVTNKLLMAHSRINDAQVSHSCSHYNYRCYAQNLISFGDGSKETNLFLGD